MFDDPPAAKKDTQKLDTLDDEGNFQAVRLRGDVHNKGFWHRYVHVWIIDLPGEGLMMQHRSASKKLFGDMWTCCTGHVLVGEPSLLHAQKAIESDFKLTYPESSFEFLFSCKETVNNNGKTLKHLIDVYALPLESPPQTSMLAVDSEEADAIRYVTLAGLQEIYRERPADHVVISNPEYPQRLFHLVGKIIKAYHNDLPQEDSDDERHNLKAKQLLDTLDESGVLSEPGRRGEVHRQSVWHRAVHVWLLDAARGCVLLQQRSKKKRHFGSQWNCSTGHVKVGDCSVPAAIKSIKDDVGLERFEDGEFEFIFQARNEADTGGGCLLKQVVDVYCVVVPSESYHEAPTCDSMRLAPGEVDAVQYIAIEELEQIWAQGKKVNPEFVVPSSDEYGKRLFYYMRQKVRKFNAERAGGTWPPWSANIAGQTGS